MLMATLDHAQHIDRHAGVELHLSFGRRHHVALEELAHRLDQLGRARWIVELAHRDSSAVEQEQKIVWANHFAPDADLFNQKVEGTAWKSKPSWSIVATEDRTVHPDLERFLAKRMGATTVEAKSSHVTMLSQPQLVLDVIRKAAKAAHGAAATA